MDKIIFQMEYKKNTTYSYHLGSIDERKGEQNEAIIKVKARFIRNSRSAQMCSLCTHAPRLRCFLRKSNVLDTRKVSYWHYPSKYIYKTDL